MKIGELARRSGLNASAIRYYERMGLLAPPHRTSGQRRYPEEALHRVLLICFAGDMGFTLGEIKLFLAGLRENAPVGPRWKRLAERKIKAVERTIERSRRLKSLLEHLLECRCGSLQICVDRLRLSKNLREISSARAPSLSR
jgi:MerR family redox-sensitive transcriptional activator SoxR